MPEIRMSVWCINRLSNIFFELSENHYKAPEQLQSSGQLEMVIDYLINEHHQNLKERVKELEDQLSKARHKVG